MRQFNFVLLMTFLFFSCSDDIVQNESFEFEKGKQSLKSSNSQICILSWNAYLLDTPSFGSEFHSGPQCNGSACIERANNICDYIGSLTSDVPDFIMLQEVWETLPREHLRNCLATHGYNFSVFEHEAGLLTASKTAFATTSFDAFTDAHSCGLFGAGCGGDTHKTKGALYARVNLAGGGHINLINTHLDAGNDTGDLIARNSQIGQIGTYINNLQLDPAAPLVIAGDMNVNVHTNSTQFNIMQNTWSATSTATLAGTQHFLTTPDGQTLDYILLSDDNGTVSNVSHEVLDVTIQNFWYISFGSPEINSTIVTEQDYYDDYENYYDDPLDEYWGIIDGGYNPGASYPFSTSHSDHSPVLSCFTATF